MNLNLEVGKTYTANNGKTHTIAGKSSLGYFYDSLGSGLTWNEHGLSHQRGTYDLVSEVVPVVIPALPILTAKGKARAAILYALADGVPIEVKTDTVRTWREATGVTVLSLLHQRASQIGNWRYIEFRVKPEIPDVPVTKGDANVALHNLLGCPDDNVATQLGDILRRFIEEAK